MYYYKLLEQFIENPFSAVVFAFILGIMLIIAKKLDKLYGERNTTKE